MDSGDLNSKATTVEKITFAGKVLLSVAAGVSIGGAGSWYESFMHADSAEMAAGRLTMNLVIGGLGGLIAGVRLAAR